MLTEDSLEHSVARSCFRKVEVRMNAHITPERLENVEEGVNQLLDQYLMKYVHGYE